MATTRRRWLKATLAGGTLLAAGGAGGALWLAGERPPVATFPDTPAALDWLAQLLRRRAHSTTPWSLAQVLEHAAQSVEYSLDGYPQLHSPTFRASVGRVAFLVFARRGRLSHATTEAIPGAPPLVEVDVAAAAHRLAAALLRFEATPAEHPFAPHFAYGALSKDDYRGAHLMHLADHAREVAWD
jgi:hypothetical protein